MTKKLHIKTFGCQMNVYDSDRMYDVLKPYDFELSDSLIGCDMVILNTCHIREKAADKVYSELGRVRIEKERCAREGKKMLVAVAGCVAQAEGEEIQKRAPFVDIVVGSQAYQRLPELIANAENKKTFDLEFATDEKFDSLPEKTVAQKETALLTIQEGCDKFCTYCVVPYTRGAEFSRPVEKIVQEAVNLVNLGAEEIILLGQNVNAYSGTGNDNKNWGLGRLIRHLAEIDGLKRISYTTSHPMDMDDDLIFAHRDVPKLLPHLHLPVQSGSDTILKAMNRGHTADDYRATINKLRSICPNITVSSDFIVGFPGETDNDFEETLRLIKDIGFTNSYSFIYSPRSGTPAAIKDDDTPELVKKERLYRLQELLAR